MKTIIAIPSYGRYERMFTHRSTIKHISPTYLSSTILYVEKEELEMYRKALDDNGYEMVELRTTERAETGHRWGAIMDLIIDECSNQCEHLVLMDDDLKLAHRPELPKNTIVDMDFDTFDTMIEDLWWFTSMENPLTTVQYRQFCNMPSKLLPFCKNQRVSMIWSLEAEFFRNHTEYRFYRESKLQFMGDYYFFMKLLRDGYENIIINKYTKDDVPNVAGGEKEKRTKEIFNYSVMKFARMFPGFVDVYVKEGKTSWGDGYYGVVIKANQIAKYGQRNKE
jgi:hypothetical protein